MKRYKAEQKRWEWDTDTKASKDVRRAIEGSERMKAKEEIRKELQEICECKKPAIVTDETYCFRCHRATKEAGRK